MKNLFYISLILILTSCTPYLTEHELLVKPKEIDESLMGTWKIIDGMKKETYLTIEISTDKKAIGTFTTSKEKESGIEKLILGEGELKKIKNTELIEVSLLSGAYKNMNCFFQLKKINTDSCQIFVLNEMNFQSRFNSSKELTVYFKNNIDSIQNTFESIATAIRIDESTMKSITNPSMIENLFGEIVYPEQVAEVAKSKSQEIEFLTNYYNSIIPKDTRVYLEFTDTRKVDFWVFKNDSTIIQVWDTDFNDERIKESIQKLGWKRENLLEIRELLYEANCISIDNLKSQIKIGQVRSGMGKYYILKFENRMSTLERDEYNNNCSKYVVDDYTLLEYGGGAIGSDCMPRKN